MFKGIHTINIFLVTLVLLLFSSTIHAQWYETESHAIGNLPLSVIYPVEFHQIPNSPYIVLGNTYSSSSLGNSAIMIEKSSLKIRGSLTRDDYKYNPIIFSNPSSGWDLYYTNEDGFYKQYISEKGEFGEKTWLYENNLKQYLSHAVTNKKEAWFIGEKIFCFTASDSKISEYYYPISWDSDFSSIKIFPTENSDNLFIIAKQNETGLFQSLFIDLETRELKTLNFPDQEFFNEVSDIQAWNNKKDKYLVLKMESVSCFDIETNEVETIANGFKTSTGKIIQTEDGNKIYFLGYAGPINVEVSSDFNILDLIEKKVYNYSLSLDEGWGFLYNYLFYDQEKNIIIASIAEENAVWGDYKPVVIDPDNLSVNNIVETPCPSYIDFEYISEDNSLLVVSENSSGIEKIYIDTGNKIKSLSIRFHTEGWSVMKGSSSPDLMSNPSDKKFCRFLPVARRELHEVDITVNSIFQFPDGLSAIIEGSNYTEPPVFECREYYFNDKRFEKINIAGIGIGYPDPNKNQIINLSNKKLDATFIEKGGSYTSWHAPCEFNFTSPYDVFDPDNNTLWLIYKDNDTGNWHFYKLSTESGNLVDSFIIDADEISEINGKVIPDPLQSYLYFINETSGDIVKRELIILDLELKDILDRILIQENVDNTNLFNYNRVVPGIVPIPDQDKLFVWDGYKSWCFDLDSMEKIYGSVLDNPNQYYFYDLNHVN